MNTSLLNIPQTNKLAAALQTATDNYEAEGLKRKPKICTDKFIFTLAPSDGKNPGNVYVKTRDHRYVGRITPRGNILTIHPIDSYDIDHIKEMIEYPEEVVVKYGKETGQCSCCGRTLTNKLSVELGIGPICRGYYFPSLYPDAPSSKPDIRDIELVDLTDALEEITLTPALTDKAATAMSIESIIHSYSKLNQADRLSTMDILLEIYLAKRDSE